MEKLTRKQKGFIRDYVKTGNGTQAIMNNYDLDNSKIPEKTASVMAVENLAKPSIAKAIAERLPDDLLEERHLELLNKREITIIEKDGEKEIIDQPETQAVSKALDMAYKIKGSYVPDKIPTTINVVLVKFLDGKDDRDTKRISEAL